MTESDPLFRRILVARFEAVESGRYTFDVRAELAYIGLLVHYLGWLERDG